MDSNVHTTHHNIPQLDDVKSTYVSVISDEGICKQHTVLCNRQTWASEPLLVANICPAIIKSTASYPHLSMWSTCLHQLAMNFHQWDIPNMQESNHSVYFNTWTCFQYTCYFLMDCMAINTLMAPSLGCMMTKSTGVHYAVKIHGWYDVISCNTCC
jgi:hypothetical protein